MSSQRRWSPSPLRCDGPERAECHCTLRIVSIIRQLESKKMNEPTETIRRNRIAEINVVHGSREDLENRYGQVWDTNQLSEEFQVIGFMAPLIVVQRKSDGVKGSLEFQHSPRLYFNWQGIDIRMMFAGMEMLYRRNALGKIEIEQRSLFDPETF